MGEIKPGQIVGDSAGVMARWTPIPEVKPGSRLCEGWKPFLVIESTESETTRSGIRWRLKFENGTESPWREPYTLVPIQYEEFSVEAEVTPPGSLFPMRVSMFTLGEGENVIGELATGAGFYSDAIVMTWKGSHRLVRGLDLFRAWVETIDPEGAKQIPSVKREM